MKSIIIKKNHEFARIYKKGRFLAAKYMVLYVIANRYGKTRVGFAAGLKCGNSVRRNRLKRIMRECYRLMEERIKTGYDLVFSAKPNKDLPIYHDMDKEMLFLLTKLNMINGDVKNT